ncbi:unnamed protein product [Vitrella brassicaformis CCMP3155]|uniref:Uncharacterized protein n=1 Tax=Vitrella brassicaformis (strain CCMP3155) TaxID=1169540 RepID=A0A0G4G024_VITBC|nr:unnamed protein product [Vitrella brassicaformis CCMP3155]|eukprot:CEM21166.1 unnamed protein product [Vitrella brassicaformis CCMP3155]
MTAAAMGAIDNAHRSILLQMNTAKKATQQPGKRKWCKLWRARDEEEKDEEEELDVEWLRMPKDEEELDVDECNDKSAICLVYEGFIRQQDLTVNGECISAEEAKSVCGEAEKEIGGQRFCKGKDFKSTEVTKM